MSEPLHNTRGDAVRWVLDNTDNTLWRGSLGDEVVRVDARGQVLILRGQEGNWFWDRLREML